MKKVRLYNDKLVTLQVYNRFPTTHELEYWEEHEAKYIDFSYVYTDIPTAYEYVNGKWAATWHKSISTDGITTNYTRSIIKKNRVNIAFSHETISEEDFKTKYLPEIKKCFTDEQLVNMVHWSDGVKDDTEGRYWLDLYNGCGVYELIIENGRIIGSIYGGFYELWSDVAFNIETRVKMDYCIFGELVSEAIARKHPNCHICKADGSGTYFYLRNPYDRKYIDTKDYVVLKNEGGCTLADWNARTHEYRTF